MSKIRMLSEVPSAVREHRAFRLLSKDITVSNKWLRMAYRDLGACLAISNKLLAVRITLTYPGVYDPMAIDPNNDDIHQFIQDVQLTLNKKQQNFIGCSYVREFGEERRKKHYHCIVYFNGYLHNTTGQRHEDYRALHNVLETCWGDVSENYHVHIDRIEHIHHQRIRNESERQLINEDLFYYLCKLESKISDGYKNYGGRVVAGAQTKAREGKKKEDAQTSSLNGHCPTDKNKSTEVNTGVLSHTPYNASSVENNDTVITFDKNRYDWFLRYFTRYWESYSKLLIVSIKYYLPDFTQHNTDSHESLSRSYLKAYSRNVEKTLQDEKIGYGGLFGTLLKDGERFYCYVILFLSGHNNKNIFYRKGGFPSLFSLFQSCWSKLIQKVTGESYCVRHVPDKSVYESTTKKNKTFTDLARSFLFPFWFNDIHSRLYSHV